MRLLGGEEAGQPSGGECFSRPGNSLDKGMENHRVGGLR